MTAQRAPRPDRQRAAAGRTRVRFAAKPGRKLRSAVAAGLVAAALTAGCQSPHTPAQTDPTVPTNPPARAPLDDPPDPPPAPARDGLSDQRRAAVVASTVRVTGRSCGVVREGSGFAVGADLVATSAHLLLGVDEPQVELADGRKLAGAPVTFDPVNDLAVLSVPGADLAPLELGDAADGAVGALLGWEGEAAPEPTPFRIDRPVTVRIDEVGGDQRVERKSWLVAARITSGDSGAALVDVDGVVVGVAYAATRRDADVAYATRATELQRLLEVSDLAAPAEIPNCR